MKVSTLATQIIEVTKSDSKIIHISALTERDMRGRDPDVTIMKSVLKRKLITFNESLLKMETFYTCQ